MGDRGPSEAVGRDGYRWCKALVAVRMVRGSACLYQLLIVPGLVHLEQMYLLALATWADMMCCSRPWRRLIFLHLSGRSNSKLVDRVRLAKQDEVVCSRWETRDGCDSDWERAACRCEIPSGFADAVPQACRRAQELAWEIDGGCAHRPYQASGVDCTSYYYDALLDAEVARARCHLQAGRRIAGVDTGQKVVRIPWVERRRRAVDGRGQQQALGCAVVTGKAPPLGAAGEAELFRVCTAWHAESQVVEACWRSDAARAAMGWMDGGRSGAVLALVGRQGRMDGWMDGSLMCRLTAARSTQTSLEIGSSACSGLLAASAGTQDTSETRAGDGAHI